MDLADAGHRRVVEDFWGSPRIASAPGLKAVELFEAVRDGRIKALWIMGTNPVVSLPEADRVREALAGCPLVVVSDVACATDTTALAHVLLPSAAWGEKGGTVTNSERRISRQRAFLPMPEEARADWWQIAEVAKRMGFGAHFDWSGPSALFAEYAALTGAGNEGTRDLDISAYATIAAEAYDALAPFQWPHPAGTAPRETRYFAEGRFFTPDGRARFVPTAFRAPASTVSKDFPLVANTGRIRDQWHTMTRTGKAARLASHMAEPFVELHPADAARYGIADAGFVMVTSAHGSIVVRALVSGAARKGSVFVPMHWTDQFAANARIDALMAADVDPVSGQPALKHTPVRVAPYAARWFAFAVSVAVPRLEGLGVWALARASAGWRAELADADTECDGEALVARLWPHAATREVLSYRDRSRGEARFAAFENERLVAALFVAQEPVACARSFLADQLGATFADTADRYRLLAGRAGAGQRDKGPIVCACLEVGRNDILQALAGGCAPTVDAVGEATRAGTNCGSCRAEIRGMIDATRHAKAG
jgi:assimilatory nitrate reductase catalytic subunit